jgi:pyridoxine/pyridoxamine 5'-phosphate oxidase
MTAKEKAIELYEKMRREEYPLPAKWCALIAVEFAREFITGDLNEAFDKFIYLQDIKEEIEKL